MSDLQLIFHILYTFEKLCEHTAMISACFRLHRSVFSNLIVNIVYIWVLFLIRNMLDSLLFAS